MSEQGGGIPDLSTMLSQITQNPQAMSMLSSILGGMTQNVPRTSTEKSEKDPNRAPDGESVPALRLQDGKAGKGKREERRRLLLALMPFLTKERKHALETLLLLLDATAMLPFGKEPPCT